MKPEEFKKYQEAAKLPIVPGDWVLFGNQRYKVQRIQDNLIDIEIEKGAILRLNKSQVTRLPVLDC